MNCSRILKNIRILLLSGVFLVLPCSWIMAGNMPQFSLSDVTTGETVESNAYNGKILLVNFWATWCPPCREELPSLKSLQEKYGDKGFSVLGVSIDKGGSKMVARFVRKIRLNYPVVLGNSSLGKEFGGFFGVPASFLIDRSGMVVKSYAGYVSHEQLEEDIQKILTR